MKLAIGAGANRAVRYTTATHLPYSAGHYRPLGFAMLPLPADFATRAATEEWSFKPLVPRSIARARIGMHVSERIGLATEAIRGGEAR